MENYRLDNALTMDQMGVKKSDLILFDLVLVIRLNKVELKLVE